MQHIKYKKFVAFLSSFVLAKVRKAMLLEKSIEKFLFR